MRRCRDRRSIVGGGPISHHVVSSPALDVLPHLHGRQMSCISSHTDLPTNISDKDPSFLAGPNSCTRIVIAVITVIITEREPLPAESNDICNLTFLNLRKTNATPCRAFPQLTLCFSRLNIGQPIYPPLRWACGAVGGSYY